jgi:AcrR family transcriptional regulator
MENPASSGRPRQKSRTRKDLLEAAARLMKEGRNPSMEEVAEAAQVSRATVYRYFPTIDGLLAEAPLSGLPGPREVFAGDTGTDPIERAVRAEAVMHEMVYRNENQLRRMLSASLENVAEGKLGRGLPVRQNRRVPLIEAALEPARELFTEEAYDRLVAGLAVVFGTESMIVFKDVLGAGEAQAREVKEWMVRRLVRAALEESLP